jgi:hypothetical protein
MSVSKKYLIFAVFQVVLLVGVFFTGRSSAPPQIQEVERTVYVDRVVTKEVEKVVEKKVEVEKIVYRNIYKDETVKEKETTTKPDGTVTVTERETVNKDTINEGSVENSREIVKVVEVEKLVEKLVYKEKEVVKYTDHEWDIDVRIGTNFTGLSVTPTAPYVNPIILGLDVERKIIGPFNAGLWVQTSHFKTVEGGVSVSVQF